VTGLTASGWIASGLCWASLVPAGARWLRVAQREHYLAGSTTRFAYRWWIGVRSNAPFFALALAAAGLSWTWPIAAVGTAAVAVIGPLGLSVRGRTSALALTRRLTTLAAMWCAGEAALVAIGFVVHRAAFLAAVAVVLVPVMVDIACLATVPIERRLASRFVAKATGRLRAVHPVIVGITGSYGKTSTKNYVAHLLANKTRVVASPGSFNNRAGLARAVNEQLVEGTEVFVAEMGTYGRGEIAELCEWCPPSIAVITAIGPVHLERFGTEDEILRAKSEITAGAATVVLNIDDDRLARLAEDLAGRRDSPFVVRCSTVDRSADVCVFQESGVYQVLAGGSSIGEEIVLPEGAQPMNVACAVGVASRLGVPAADQLARLADLPTVPHRLAVATAPSGVVVIDDTYNSNPAGARAALGVLRSEARQGRRVVVTPGMVELGKRQAEENRVFGNAALEVATDLIVVGQTNRSALVAEAGQRRPITVRTREDAVCWVRENLVSGDAVLYENDLPDHYP
jgi:UDP-N-acetylmuramoyl-tripeptide--D-alanyl-D-alanine ligase